MNKHGKKNGYAWNDQKLQAHIQAGGNYGVICGFGNLVVVDFDNEAIQKEVMPQLPATFTIKSGRGLLHAYFICPDNQQSFKALDSKKETLFDVQGQGKQIVAPGSTHPNGNKYSVVSDLAITQLDYAELRATLSPYLEDLESKKPFIVKKNDLAEQIKQRLNVRELLREYSVNISRNPTGCPMHHSKGGKCFSFKEDVWHCFHCDKGGDVINLFMEKERVDFKQAISLLCEKLGIENKKNLPQGKEKQEKTTISLSSYETPEFMFEQVFEVGVSKFAKFAKSTGEISYVQSVELEEVSIIPIQGEEVTKGAVLLPSKAEPYESEEQLDGEIKGFVHEWLDIPADMEQFALWNIKRSWVFEKFHSLNYLRALGDTGQGKSRFLDTLGALHYKPIFTSGATTSAPVFRIIDKWRGTMIFDEADLKITDETAEIIKIINQGYERGRHVMRCDQNDASKVLFFDPFCPKILATRKPFEDKAVESRCITAVMTGTKRKDISFTLTKAFFEKSLQIRNKLLMWRFHNYNKIDSDRRSDVDFSELEPRVQQVVSSYIAMFGNNPEQMEKFKSFITQYQEELIQERANSFEGLVVKGIYELFHDKGELDISAQDIIEQTNLTDRKGEALKPRALTNVLKELGFGKIEIRKADGKTKRCIPLEPDHLAQVFKRYGYEVTKVTVVTGTGDTKNNTLLDGFSASSPDPGGSP